MQVRDLAEGERFKVVGTGKVGRVERLGQYSAIVRYGGPQAVEFEAEVYSVEAGTQKKRVAFVRMSDPVTISLSTEVERVRGGVR